MARKNQSQMDALLSRYHSADKPLYWSETSETKKIKVPNPRYYELPPQNREIVAKTMNIPAEIEQEVQVQSWQNQDVLIEAYRDPVTGDFEVIREKLDATPGTTSSVGAQQRAKAEEEAAEIRRERQWNLNNGPQTVDANGNPGRGSGLAESHAERAARERLEQADVRNRQDQDWQRQNQERAQRQEDAAIAERERQRKLDQQRADLEQRKFEADQAPKPYGTPNDTTRQIAVWDARTGTMKSVDNPMYDEAKVRAAQLKDQLSTGIALNQITAQQAAQQYKQWWDTNVELPFKQAAEVRARAAEQREALAAEDRRKQFASDFSLRQSDLGFRAGQAAAENEIALLPYRAGPTAAAEFSSAFNSLAKGGKIAGPDASAGINFTPEAFQFDRPDFEKIARNATKNALKGITKYSPEGSFSQGDYSGISMPTGEGAPSSTGGGIDLSELWRQYAASGDVPAYSGPQE